MADAGDFGEGVCGWKFSGAAAEDIEEAVLGGLHEDLPRAASDFEIGEDGAEAEIVAALGAAKLENPGGAVAGPGVKAPDEFAACGVDGLQGAEAGFGSVAARSAGAKPDRGFPGALS